MKSAVTSADRATTPYHDARVWRLLSASGEYALHAALYIAARDQAELTAAVDIADALAVPRNYLSKVLNSLSAAGTLVSTRGPRGGFRLARPPEDISLAEVLAPFDAVGAHAQCLIRPGSCDEKNPCIAHNGWIDVSTRIRAFFRNTSIADLLESEARDLRMKPRNSKKPAAKQRSKRRR
jgi:Rrf2 family protein